MVLAERREGLVVKAQSGFFTVETDGDRVVCEMRGRLKEEMQDTDPCVIGDRVQITALPGGGVIEEIYPRACVLSRATPAPAGRGSNPLDREQVIIANPDQVIFVFSVVQPAPNLRKLDRLLVAAEAEHIPSIVICANKVDLVDKEAARAVFGLYEDIGYPVLYTSATQSLGIDALREQLTGKISALSGSSGVGKSSLLNAVQPGLGLAIKQVSAATTKGRHTTRHSEMFPLAGGGYVADTPGIRSVALWNIEPAELDGYFIEMRPYVGECRFADCTHIDTPGCAVAGARAAGAISEERFDSYLRLREELEAFYWGTDRT
ncbi:MAG: ribosome small subunit-dependent GTPase A [Anaerolineae bacterium]|nr:ribosome small subunit-dependent GTPase A [Anaerolineae bacterium]